MYKFVLKKMFHSDRKKRNRLGIAGSEILDWRKDCRNEKEENHSKLPKIESHCDPEVSDSFNRIPDADWLRDARRVKCKVATGRIEDLGKIHIPDSETKRFKSSNYTGQHKVEENDLSKAEESGRSGEEEIDFCITGKPNVWKHKDIWKDEKRIEKVKLDSFIDAVPKFEIDMEDDTELDTLLIADDECHDGSKTVAELALKKKLMCENNIREIKNAKAQLERDKNQIIELEYKLQLKIDWINLKNQMTRKYLDEINWNIARFPKRFTFDDIGTSIVPKSEEQLMKEINKLENEGRWLDKYIQILSKEKRVFKNRGPYPDNVHLEYGFISMGMEFLKRKFLKDFGEPFVYNYKMKTFPLKEEPIPYEHLRPCDASVIVLNGNRKFLIAGHLGKTEVLPKLEESPNLESFADIPINKSSTGLEDVKTKYKMDNLAIHNDKKMKSWNDCKEVGGIKLSYELKFDRQIFLDNISKINSGNTTSSKEASARQVYPEGSSFDLWMETKSLEPEVVRVNELNDRIFTNYKEYMQITESPEVIYVSNGYYEEERVIVPEQSEQSEHRNDETESETVSVLRLRQDVVVKSASFESVLDWHGFTKQSVNGRRISMRDWRVSDVMAYLNDENRTAVNHDGHENVSKAVCFEVEIGDQKKLSRKPKLFSDKCRKKLDNSIKDDKKKIKAKSAGTTKDVKVPKPLPNKHKNIGLLKKQKDQKKGSSTVIRSHRETYGGQLKLSKNRLQNARENDSKNLDKGDAVKQKDVDHMTWVKRFRYSNLHENACISSKIPVLAKQTEVSVFGDSNMPNKGVIDKDNDTRTDKLRKLCKSRIPVRKNDYVWKASVKVKSEPSLRKQSNKSSRIPLRIRSEYNTNARNSNAVVCVTHVKMHANLPAYKNAVSRIPIRVKANVWRSDKQGFDDDEKQKQLVLRHQLAPLSKFPIPKKRIMKEKRKEKINVNRKEKRKLNACHRLNSNPVYNGSARSVNNNVDTRQVVLEAPRISQVIAKDRVEKSRPHSAANGLFDNRKLHYLLIKRIGTPELIRPLSALSDHTILRKSPLPPIGNKNGVAELLSEHIKHALPPVRNRTSLGGRPMSAPSSRCFFTKGALPPILRPNKNVQASRHFSASPGG